MMETTTSVGALLCEYEHNPLGIDVIQPRLSWQLQADRRGARQSAYQLLVATSPAFEPSALLWDSGKVISAQATHIVYAGPPLYSRMQLWWKVRAWDERDQPTDYSEAATWEMGLLRQDEWQAEWIGAAKSKAPFSLDGVPKASESIDELIIRWEGVQQASIAAMEPCAFLRKDFQVARSIKRARVYASARGLYELSINGQRVGQDYFRPGWTEYSVRIQYQTYDVTAQLVQGANAIGILLGDGWYCGNVGFEGDRYHYGQIARGLLQLEITYDDDSTQILSTDSSWKTAPGPILYSDFLMGESYDARNELTGWSTPQYNDARWTQVQSEPRDNVLLVAQCGPTVRETEALRPRTVREHQPGVYIFDLGQNISGWTRLKARGEAGTTIQLRHAEILNPDGSLYVTNLRSAKATDYYTLKGGAEEVYEPHFTFHGFRYIEVAGYPGAPTLDDVTGIVLQSATPPAGRFTSSNELVNQLQRNIEWGQRGNFLEVPTDCPQRDERLGWMGDAQIFVRTATYNADVAHFFTKWVQDIRDAQFPAGGYTNIVPRLKERGDGSSGWAEAGVIVPWTIYEAYGDVRILEDHYDSMTRWVRHVVGEDLNYQWKGLRKGDWGGFGDWLSIEADTPKDLLTTAFLAYSITLMAKIAQLLGKEQDSEQYQQLFEQIRVAFNTAYVSEDGHILGETQTCYALALHFDLLPAHLRENAARYLVENIEQHHGLLSTGFLGVGHLMPALTEAGQLETAYRLLLNEEFPSWGYSIRHGATTIWERWDGWTEEKGFQSPGMNSFNHYSLGSVGEWLYRYVTGIDSATAPGEAGYKHIVLRPYPGNVLSSARASLDTLHGRIVSAWQKEGSNFDWHISIPPNTSATVYIDAPISATILESGKPAYEADGVTLSNRDHTRAIYNVEAGNYHFTVS